VAVAAAGAAAVLALTSNGDEPGNPARAGSPEATASPTRTATPTPRVTQTIRHVGHRPNGIAIANGDLWVTSANLPRITRIDEETGHERRQHPNVGRGATAVAGAGTSVWVVVKGQSRVVRIDARTGRVTKRLNPGAVPSRVAAGLGSVWVAARTGPPWLGEIIRYDGSGRELGRTPLPRPPSAVVTGDGFVWVTLEEDIRLLRLDPRTGSIIVWTRLSAPGTALSYGAGFVWATLNSIDSIARISPRHRVSVPTAVGHSPAHSVAVGGRVFVAITTDHVLRLVNPATARVVGAPVSVSLGPFAVTADDRDVWVTGLGENTVSRIAYR
jgi:streptogramin lyase